MFKPLLSLVAAAIAMATHAGSMQFSYLHNPGEEVSWWGTGNKDIYDVAIHLNDPSLVGKTVTGMRVPFIAPSASNISLWLSTTLSLKKNEAGKKVANPDICQVSVSPTDGFLTVTFDEPYTITADGLYAGYSFEITDGSAEQDQNPIAVYQANNSGGFYIHSTRKYMSWQAISSNLSRVAAIEVTINGIEGIAASVTSIPKTLAPAAQESMLGMLMANHGSEPISSIDYSYEVAGVTHTGHLDFSSPLLPLFNVQNPVEIPLAPIANSGTYAGKITIDKVNGQTNGDTAPSCDFTLVVMPFVPTYKSIMEEYTGFWCGYCPRGFACLERMKAEYGSDFIGVSYHKNDILEIKNGVPSEVKGFPDSRINRQFDIDPGYAEIQPKWLSLRDNLPIADVTPAAWWTDDSYSTIQVSATTRFVGDEENANYRVVYVLVENGISGQGRPKSEDWNQHNYYYQDSTVANDPFMDVFYNTDGNVKNLIFNDVAIYSPDHKGSEESVPETVKAGEEYKHEITINASDVVNAEEDINLIFHPDQLFLVTILVDGSTGYAINSARCAVEMPSSIPVVESANLTTPQYYDLMGHRIIEPVHGIFVKVQNGKATKVSL